ncbi:MAG TPA: hypothetical protein VNF47_13555 [Streptosporangiaceae bacterium]|nr:hypothetical protein [Streptosporangiaceae bacterium]
MRFSRFISAPVRRGVLGLLLIGVVLFPGGTGGAGSGDCGKHGCLADGTVLWSRPLPGPWVAESGAEGVVYGQGQAYAAVRNGVAALGFGLTVDAFDAATGFPRWAATVTGMPPGASIGSVRAWSGVITVGVQTPSGGPSTAGSPAASDLNQTGRVEVVLDAVTGKRLRSYRAAWYGGAVSADRRRTVIVGLNSIISYDNVTGRAIWRDPTGAAGQGWRVDGRKLYVTVSARGEVGTAPVTAVRQIDLRTGAERLIQPQGSAFDGTLSGAVDGVLLFSGAGGLSIYDQATGRLLGHRPGAVPEGFDSVRKVLYVDISGVLTGVGPVTGQTEPGIRFPGPSGAYGVRAGVALGLDSGTTGAAWGFSIASKRVIWTTRALPWPHFFLDPSGIGGSADPSSGTVLLATCDLVGQAVRSAPQAGGSGFACLRPMLVAIER